jgi:pimeloyl-ACP methyl ester carboxylesterase
MLTESQSWGLGQHRIIGIHGWFGPDNSWKNFGHWINPRRFTWALPDLRGYGSRRLEAGHFTIDEAAQDVLELADSLSWDQFSLVGHSMGALVAQRLLADHAARVQKFVAITPVPAAGIPFDDTTREFFASAADRLENRRMILNRSTGSRHLPNVISALLESSVLSSTPEAFRGYFASWSTAKFADELLAVTNSVKVIVGVNDTDLTLEVVKSTFGKTFDSCAFVQLEGCGHYPMLEAPLELVREIELFLDTELTETTQ